MWVSRIARYPRPGVPVGEKGRGNRVRQYTMMPVRQHQGELKLRLHKRPCYVSLY